jgi:6-phosphofructokinase
MPLPYCCRDCGTKDPSRFGRKIKTICKRCESARKREKLREVIYAYLLEHPCVGCGESDPIVLEFDHIDRSDKTSSVNRLLADKVGIKRLMAEIAKCQVLCANCHRRKTAVQMGWKGRGNPQSKSPAPV